MNQKLLHHLGILGLAISIVTSSLFTFTKDVAAEVDYTAESEYRKTLPIASNAIPNWPQGPAVSAEGAILIEANTGAILYAKNIDEKLSPASTTKIMTSLLAIENSSLDEMVTFSNEAVFSIERGSSNMGMDVGQSINMEQCLYGILVYSANEVCNAVAEHISGDINSYVSLMNQKAKELGCTNTNFVTTNGLYDENHYTTARDLSTIARSFFANETLTTMSSTNHYYIPPTDTQPDDKKDLWTHNKLTAGTYSYEGYVGGKTGYTSQARQTLVSCAERNGMKLICVVLKEESPNQFLDTISLFDYGFQNFQMVNISQNEKNYELSEADVFQTDSEIFFDSADPIQMNEADCVVIPNTISFTDLISKLEYKSSTDDKNLAVINYTYQDTFVGCANISVNIPDSSSEFDKENPAVTTSASANNAEESQAKIIFINVLSVIGIVILCIIGLLILLFCYALFKNQKYSRRRKYRLRRKSKRRKNDFHYYDDYRY